jgi:hypothetical protein
VPRPVGVVHEDRSAVLLGREACGSDGTVEDTTSCALGCHAQEARCNDLDPSNGLAPHLDLAVDATDIVLTDGAVIDTTSGSVTNGNGSGLSVSSAFDDAGRPVGIFVIRAKSFRAGDVTVRGDRALAIVSDGDVILEGVLSVSADLKENGPGALPEAGCTGEDGPGDGPQWAGGGGGGYGTAGGKGGNAGSHQGGAGGEVAGNLSIQPLRGGCPGGGGASSGSAPEHRGPGGGGGAVQVVSRTRIEIHSNGFLAAQGAGAKGYTGGLNIICINGAACFPGHGGGSGGGILIEAPEVLLASGAGLVANGGGGTCDRDGTAEAGQLSIAPARGVLCAEAFRGNGGDGAARDVAASPGGNGTGEEAHGGGGGGGAGRIRVNIPLGTTFAPPGTAVVSPTAAVGQLSLR